MQALAASGLRAIRYAKEVEQVGTVIACDNDKGIYTCLGGGQQFFIIGLSML